MKTFYAATALSCLGAFPLAGSGAVMEAQLVIVLTGVFSAALSN